MKLKEYLNMINTIIEQRGDEALEAEVVYSADDAGTCFSTVQYLPNLGEYNAEKNEFTPVSDSGILTHICVN